MSTTPRASRAPLIAELFQRYGTDAYQRNLAGWDHSLSCRARSDEDLEAVDKFRHTGAKSAEDIRRTFSEQFDVGCEADDPMIAFDTDRDPLGGRR